MQPYVIVPQQGSEQADEWVRLGVEAQVAGKLPQAQGYYNQALRLDPRHAVATQNLAIVFAQSNLLNEGLLCIERACMFDTAHAVMRMNYALMLLEADRYGHALKIAREAVAVKPCVETHLALALVLGACGEADEAIEYYNLVIDEQPLSAMAGNVCFAQTLTTMGPEQLRQQRDKWYQTHRFTGKRADHGNDRNADRPIRVGYVGGDFKRHSAAMIFGRVALHHSPQIVPYFYSTLPVDPNSDPVTKQFQAVAGDRWRDVTTASDEQIDAQIRQDKIDILIDLAAHTNGGRLALFTRKPAPVQVHAWGFAHGTGLPEMDYFLADPVAIPEEERKHYTEKIWDLPCIVTYEPPLDYNLKGTSTSPYFTRGYVTFGTYARFEKLSKPCLDTFAEILRQVPDSKLELKDHGFRRPSCIRKVLAAMPDIEPERLLFSISTTHPDHMLAYQQADLILDPFPHTGGIVGLEQLFMGVPIVTLYGTQAAGRSTSSVLTAMGKTQWIAKTREQYVDLAVSLVSDVRSLSKERKTLRDQLLKSPVCEGYVEAVETAYRGMWQRWCEGG